jgi:hypothetical protein
MQPIGVLIESSKSPFFQEGSYYEFNIFEKTARFAAQQTPVDTEGESNCVEIMVYFQNSPLQMPAHLHIDCGGDYGFLDWVGNTMRYTDEAGRSALTAIKRTYH